MTSSDIMTCINSALNDADWWMKNEKIKVDIDIKEMRITLRTLKAFVICARKMQDHANLGSFMVRIEDVLREKVDELHASVLDDVKSADAESYRGGNVQESQACSGAAESDHGADIVESEARSDGNSESDSDESDETLSPMDRALNVATWSNEFIEESVAEIKKWYIAMLDRPAPASSLTANEVLEIISIVLESIADLESLNEFTVCGEQMMFLKSLIQFVNHGSSEAWEDLLAYAEGIAVNFAYLFFRSQHGYERFVSEEVSTLVQEIRPVDPRVHQIYTRALSSLKVSGKLPDSAAVNHFLDSLVATLWEILRMDMVSKMDQLQELYEGLRSLRSAVFIKQQKTSLERNIADLVCDVGICICSFHQAGGDEEVRLQKLLETLKTTRVDVGNHKDLQTLKLNHPKPSSYAYVDFILEKLLELTSYEAESAAKSHAGTIQEELASVRCLLGKVADLRDEKVEIQTLWDRLLEVAYKVEDEMDHQDSFSMSFDSIMRRIGNIKDDVLKIQVKDVRRPSIIHAPSKSERTHLMSNEVVGFRDEEKRMIDRLRGGSQHLEIISIVGMPGLGKTTLATKVFNDPSLSRHFSTSAWCPISQAPDKRKVLLDLLKQVCPKTEDFSEMSEDDLANKLRQSLKGKRYLIYLDDIWNLETWYSLKDSFPDDSKQSRIILTTRSHEMPDQEPIILSELSIKESMEILRRRLFPGEGNAWPVELHDLGMQMAERCKGLPLAIVVLAGVLANEEVEDWKTILDGFSFVSNADYCKHTLELSHKHLPDHLKPCLLYFGAFPEDKEIQVKRLLRLWIAEGFVRKSETKSLEDVAEDYLRALIGRSLIMAAARRSDGGVKTCRIHDLLRDFCLQQSKDEHFFHFVVGRDELLSFNEPHNLRRLCIDSGPGHFQESRLICRRARSFHLSGSQTSQQLYPGMLEMLHSCKLLKVLDLEQVKVVEFPSEIRQLVLLAFLAVHGQNMDIPSWIDSLSRLESFIISQKACRISFPDSLWNMQKLKYLYTTSNDVVDGGRLPTENLENSSVLYELDSFSGAAICLRNMERLLRKFPNVRKLKCKLFLNRWDKTDGFEEFVFPDLLSRLEALTMSAEDYFRVSFGFASLTNLKRLNLSKFRFVWEIFSIIGDQLPELEVLKLHRLYLEGEEEEYTWEMKEGEFAKLRILHLSEMPIRRWIACDEHEFECFQKLVLEGCNEIEELPSCLESIETLEMIELHFCNKNVESLVINIKEAQEDWGNAGMKLEIRN